METKSKAIKKDAKKTAKASTNYKITKPNNSVIYRDDLSDAEVKSYEAKGCKVEGK
tara:strand:+ start:834 stop:1001 length:168 start_codon:yes stop_codon:yes gene_type:complete